MSARNQADEMSLSVLDPSFPFKYLIGSLVEVGDVINFSPFCNGEWVDGLMVVKEERERLFDPIVSFARSTRYYVIEEGVKIRYRGITKFLVTDVYHDDGSKKHYNVVITVRPI